MRNSALYLLLLSFLFSWSPIYSQQNEELKNKIIEDRIEYLSEDDEVQLDYTSVFNQLSFYFENPINLNRASLDELRSIGLFSDIQIVNLLDHIDKNGKLITLEELQSVQGFSLDFIRRVLPFVRINSSLDTPRLSLNTLLKNGDNQLVLQYQQVLENKKGFLESSSVGYKGNPSRLITRYRYKFGSNVSLGIVAEKDAGEEFFKGSQSKGFDFYSAHFFLQNRGKLKQLALGDYQVQFGQGLTFWSGLAFGKSVDVMLVKRNAVGLKPYYSVDENRFLRGAASTLKFNNIEVTTFYSKNKMDATVIQSDTDLSVDEGVSFTSLKQTGFHRTNKELESKDVVNQQLLGGRIAYVKRRFSLGVIGVNSVLDGIHEPNYKPYSLYNQPQTKQTNIGIEFNQVYENFNFYGEISKSLNAGIAYVGGALMALHPNLSLSILYRNYAKDFQPIQGAAVGENSINKNEKGLFLGLIAHPIKKISLLAYFDRFEFPWLKYLIHSPSFGYQYLAQITCKPSRKVEMYFRVKQKNKLSNTRVDLKEGVDYVAPEKQTNYRFNIVYQVSEKVKLKNRVELINHQIKGSPFEVGYLIYQDVIFRNYKSPFSFSFRYGIFDTDSYTSRVYAYENDLPYTFSIPAYYNKGIRTYLTCRYKIKRGVGVWLRYGLFYYDNLSRIGSGLEQISGNTKSEIKAQFYLKF
ncbi:helix-hairpin-helix domain-containing protein [bacterium]|nr:helix-hairpin-helix domain-containing protein [bacterium]